MYANRDYHEMNWHLFYIITVDRNQLERKQRHPNFQYSSSISVELPTLFHIPFDENYKITCAIFDRLSLRDTRDLHMSGRE